MATFHEALKHRNKLSPMLRRPEVTGIGVGYADADKPSRGAAIIVYTRKNIATAEISKNIGRVIGSTFPVRYISSGPFKPHASAQPATKKMSRHLAAPKKRVRAAFFRSRIRPVPGGTSIGRFRGTAGSTGTCGLIVIRNGQLFMLSNNHVIIQANQFSASILQPGPADGGRLNNDVVGTSVQFVRFNLSGPNFMDAAIAQPFSNALLNPRYLVSSTGQFITPRGHLNSYAVGDRFLKSGRTTGLVFGTVESIGVQVNVGPYPELGNAFLQFRNQTVLTGPNNISLPGDSGSVWMSGGFAAALNFAGSGTRSISTPIASVMSTFGLRVAAPAGTGVFKAGTVKGTAPNGNFAYVRPLSSVERKQVRVVRAVSPK